MSELLTTHDVQERLKVDRITVYRMLQDGRLRGIKIGQQWRFESEVVERLLDRRVVPASGEAVQDTAPIPTHCVQTIQDLCSDVSGLGAVVLDLAGRPLTLVSNPSAIWQLLCRQPAGQAAQQAVWATFAASVEHTTFTCPVGLQYTAAPILDDGRKIGMFLLGGFYSSRPEPRTHADCLRKLALAYDLPLDTLWEAAARVPVIDPQQHARAESWACSAARAIHSILHERLCFITRLQKIADLTQLS